MVARLLGLLPPGVERVAHARALGLDREIDQRSGPAEGRGAVPVSKSSLEVVPPNGMSRCVWTSMPPGSRSMPVASITSASHVDQKARRISNALAFDQNIGRCASCVAVTTVPLLRSVVFDIVSSQDSAGRPRSTRSMVMQFSTSHTSPHSLQPTHSSSSTLSTLLRAPFAAPLPASLSAVTAILPPLPATISAPLLFTLDVHTLMRAFPTRDITQITPHAFLFINLAPLSCNSGSVASPPSPPSPPPPLPLSPHSPHLHLHHHILPPID